MTALPCALQVDVLLADHVGLLEIGKAAAAKARSWTQAHNAAKLQELVHSACALSR